jgi:hypothetical protein
MSKKIPAIPVPLTVHDLARWCSDLGVSNATVDAVIGKAPGSFKKYLEGINRMKHDDFVTLQDWLRTRADALRKA